MNAPIEVLYAMPSSISNQPDVTANMTPVVRYSDHCAALQLIADKLEGWRKEAIKYENRCIEHLKHVEQLCATCERLQAELTMAKYGQQAVNKLVEEINKPRWDGKLKAL